MPPIVLYFSHILVFAPPSALYLGTRFEQSQKMFICAPIVKTLTMKHVIFVVPVVVFIVREDLKT